MRWRLLETLKTNVWEFHSLVITSVLALSTAIRTLPAENCVRSAMHVQFGGRLETSEDKSKIACTYGQ